MKKSMLIIFVLLISICFAGCTEKYDPAPRITKGEFPFVVEYEIDGQRYLIEDAVLCTFEGYSAENNFAIFGYPYSRRWSACLKSTNEDDFGICLMESEKNSPSAFTDGQINFRAEVFIDYGSAEYYMGEPDDTQAIPRIRYYEEFDGTPDISFTTLTDEQLEKHFGIKIIRFEFSKPIENVFDQSHEKYL